MRVCTDMKGKRPPVPPSTLIKNRNKMNRKLFSAERICLCEYTFPCVVERCWHVVAGLFCMVIFPTCHSFIRFMIPAFIIIIVTLFRGKSEKQCYYSCYFFYFFRSRYMIKWLFLLFPLNRAYDWKVGLITFAHYYFQVEIRTFSKSKLFPLDLWLLQ